MNSFDFDLHKILSQLWQGLLKQIPIIVMCCISAIISVHFQLKQRKIVGRVQAFVAFLVAFSLAIMVWKLVALKFEVFYAVSAAILTGMYGKEIIGWTFLNWDGLMTGIAAFFKINIKRK